MTYAGDDKRRTDAYLKTRVIISATILLLLALGFNTLLNSASLEKLYVESLASSYQVVGKELQIKLETALRFGKNIKKFIGIDAILENTLGYMTGQDYGELGVDSAPKRKGSVSGRYVSVALPDGKVLYSTDKTQLGSMLPKEVLVDFSVDSGEQDTLKTSGFTKHKNSYFVTLPVSGWGGKWIATVVLAFDENQVKALLHSALYQNLKMGGIIIVSGILLLLIALNLVLPREREKLIQTARKITNVHFGPKKREFSRRSVKISLFIIIILCQMAFSTFSTLAFKDNYLSISKEKSIMLSTLLRNDIEYLLDKGLRINKLLKIEIMMGKILPALPEVSDITVFSMDGTALYYADQEGVVDFTKTTTVDNLKKRKRLTDIIDEYNVRLIITGREKEGYISTNISRAVVFSKVREIIFDSMTILLIAIFLSVELMIVVFQFLEKRMRTADLQGTINYETIRPAAFLFLFGVDISISFLPLHMEKLYQPILGLSKDVVMGLPISVEMLFAGITIVTAGAWLDRRGWHEPFLAGLFLAGLGILYSWLAPDALHFIISRGVVGLGYGFSWMSFQGFVITYADEKSQTHGLAQIVAGIIAGSICGGAAGAMLAQRIGYHPVFLIGAVIVFSVMIYAVVFLRNALRKPVSHVHEQVVDSAPKRQTMRFFFNRNVSSLILLSALPAAVAIVGFLYYFSPVYLNRIGSSQSTIGRIYMIYGICLVYIAPFVSKYIDASENKKKYVVVSGVLASLGFMTFYLSEGVTAIVLVVLMLGFASSFETSQKSYLLKLEASRVLGAGKTMALFNAAARGGQVLGPILFGWLIAATEAKQGIYYFGLLFLASTFLFLLLAQSDRKMTGT